jgi:hypothetical protein
MVHLIRLFPVIIILLLSSCTAVLLQSYSESHPETAEEPECTEIQTEKAIQRFSENPKRSLSFIKNKFSEHNDAIISFFTNHPNLVSKKESVIKVCLQPDGLCFLPKDSLSIQFDSSAATLFTILLSKLQFDILPDYPFQTTFSINVSKVSPKEYQYSISDSVKYSLFRSKQSIIDVVMKNLPYLRYAYNWRLRQIGGIEGKIVVKFAIDEYGKVVFAQLVSTQVHDLKLENDIIMLIKRWRFCPINSPGDVTEVIYPFVFYR